MADTLSLVFSLTYYVQSIPHKWIHGFEVETAGHLDRDAEIYLSTDIPQKPTIQQDVLVKRGDGTCRVEAVSCSYRTPFLFSSQKSNAIFYTRPRSSDGISLLLAKVMEIQQYLTEKLVITD